MTALLTDGEIFDEAEEFTVNPISTDSFRQGFRLGAEYARSIYEARLAEDAKVRAEMTAALEQARAWVRGDDEPKILMSRIEAALAAAKEIK